MEKEQIKFTIQSLLTEKNGRLSGPMSPMLFAAEMGKSLDFKFNRLARLWFTDEKVHQYDEDGGLTGHDTLLVGMMYPNDLWLSLWVDEGVGGKPVAMAYRSDGEVVLTEVYRNSNFARKLTETEIANLFQIVFNDSQLIDLRK